MPSTTWQLHCGELRNTYLNYSVVSEKLNMAISGVTLLTFLTSPSIPVPFSRHPRITVFGQHLAWSEALSFSLGHLVRRWLGRPSSCSPAVSETELCSTTQVDANKIGHRPRRLGQLRPIPVTTEQHGEADSFGQVELHQVVGKSEQLFACSVCDQTVFDTPTSMPTNRPLSHTADGFERSHNSRWYRQLGQGACGSRSTRLPFTRSLRSRVVCWSRLSLGAGGYTSQQLQRLGLGTHVLHSLAHSIWAGRVNPQSRTIQARPDRRDELTVTRAREPSTSTASLWAQTCNSSPARPTRTRRSPDTCIVHPHSQHCRAFHEQRLFDPSDADQDGILPSAIGVIPCGACVARSVMFRLSTFPASTSHCGAECFKALGTVSRQSDVMSTAFRHSCPLPSSSTAPPSARARSGLPIRPIRAETEPFTKALAVSVSWELPPGGPCSCSTRATLAVARPVRSRPSTF